MAAVTRYNAKECSVEIDGVYITQYAEDMVECSKDEDLYEAETGAQGDVIVSEKNDSLGTIKVTVQATCPQKGFLTGLQHKEVPIWVNVTGLNETIGGSKARLKKPPTIKRGATADALEYEFGVFDYTQK